MPVQESHPTYRYEPPVDLGLEQIRRLPVVIVGAGPVGLAAAAEFATLGRDTVLLDEADTVSAGSRAICW